MRVGKVDFWTGLPRGLAGSAATGRVFPDKKELILLISMLFRR